MLTASAGLAPGEIATLFGVGLGPAPGISGQPDAKGVFPTQLGGVSVQFSAVPDAPLAPLLYVGPGQINFQVPFFFIGGGTLTVNTPSGPLPPIQLSGAISSAGIFQSTGSTFAAALNQDGSVNGPSNPAPVGSIISLFVTGLTGGPDPIKPNGVISTTAVPIAAFGETGVEVFATDDLSPLPVLYAGTAPGLINGVSQVNVQLPGSTNPTLTLYVLGVGSSVTGTSNAVQIYTQ